MENKNIDYCNSALKVLSAILDNGKKHFSYEEGERIAGIYWKPIVQEMVDAKAGYSDYGSFNATITANLLPLLAETTALRERLSKEEYDRNLNHSGIKTAKTTAWIAIAISVASLAVAILSATVWK